MSQLHCLSENFFCKIVPADVAALVGHMIIPIFVGFDHIHQQARQIIGVGRCADLIGYDFQGVMCLADIQHRLDEVLAVDAEHPCNPDDKILVQGLRNCKLAFQLRLSVNV